MGKMEFNNIVVNEESTVFSEFTSRKAKVGSVTAYDRLWKLLINSSREGKEVIYEEYFSEDESTYGRLCCRGSITD